MCHFHTEEYHCEDYYTSGNSGDWGYYVRRPLNVPTDEACLRVYQDANLIVHVNNATGVGKNSCR